MLATFLFSLLSSPLLSTDLHSHAKGRTQIEGVWKQRVKETFGPKREKVAGGWRRLHNEEFRNLYSLPNIYRMSQSRRMRWTKHVARKGEIRYFNWKT
jgi:hypothetical protein